MFSITKPALHLKQLLCHPLIRRRIPLFTPSNPLTERDTLSLLVQLSCFLLNSACRAVRPDRGNVLRVGSALPVSGRVVSPGPPPTFTGSPSPSCQRVT